MVAERLAMATEVVDLAEGIGDRRDGAAWPRLRRSDLLEVGDLAGFDADLAAAEQTAHQRRQLHHRWQLPLARATRAVLAGRFVLAEELAAQGLAIGRRAGDKGVGSVTRRPLRPCGICRAASARRSSCSSDCRPASRRCWCTGLAWPSRSSRPATPTRRGPRSSG